MFELIKNKNQTTSALAIFIYISGKYLSTTFNSSLQEDCDNGLIFLDIFETNVLSS